MRKATRGTKEQDYYML